jgi:uncharacterized protein YndB with AHSA1/START domain
MDAKVDKTQKITTPSDLEIAMTRVFDAPRHLVFDAMTKPEHVRRWFGCAEFALPVCEIDLRVGGDGHLNSGIEKGVAPAYDRLAELVATLQAR